MRQAGDLSIRLSYYLCFNRDFREEKLFVK